MVVGFWFLGCMVSLVLVPVSWIPLFRQGRVDNTAPVWRWMVWWPSSELNIPRCLLVTLQRHWGHWSTSASQVAMHVLQNLCSQWSVHKFSSWM